MTNTYMMRIYPLKKIDIPPLLNDIKVCSTLFFDCLQRLKYMYNTHIILNMHRLRVLVTVLTNRVTLRKALRVIMLDLIIVL